MSDGKKSERESKIEAMDPSTASRVDRISHGGGRIQIMSAPPSLDYDEFQSGSEEENGSESEEDVDGAGYEEAAVVAPQQVGPQKQIPQRPLKKAKPNPTSRAIVDEFQMIQLVKAYRHEFSIFCRGKKRAPKQMIPKKVWVKVYREHFLPLFPNVGFEEDTLRKHLREQLAELNTGIADVGHTPVLQDEIIASEVRATDCSATRNILRLRRGFVDVVSTSADRNPSMGATRGPGAHGPTPLTRVASAPATLFSGPRTPIPAAQGIGQASQTQPRPTQATTNSSADSHRPTKADMLHKQADAVCSIAKNFQDATDRQGLLMDAKRAKHELVLLKEAKEHGLLDENQFKERLKRILKF